MFKSTISDDDNLRDLYATKESESDPISESEENESIYLAKNELNKMDIILIVSDQSMREKNELTAKTINKWTMNMLESCERISDDVIRIRFDTIKRDKRERVYQLEKDQGRKLDNFLRNILAQRPLSDLMIIFRCANCALQFSQEKLPRKSGKKLGRAEREKPQTETFKIIENAHSFLGKGVKCPDCGSTYVIEMKELLSSPKQTSPLKQTELPKELEPIHLEKSNSHSSIGEIINLLPALPGFVQYK